MSGSLPMIAGLLMLLLSGVAATAWLLIRKREKRRPIERRLRVNFGETMTETPEIQTEKNRETELADAAAKKAADFYSSSDPDNVVRLRKLLMKAGYMNPDAVGRFFLLRFITLGVGLVLGAFALYLMQLTPLSFRGSATLMTAIVLGYFTPSLVLSRLTAKRGREYSNGFPDFMDLMIVCSDAGLSLEASIERVSRELQATYPALASNLVLVSLELRAGRSISEAMTALSDRLGLDEVRSFATLLNQSKELGTSLSNTLRVFSDEMRHKRMSAAEEKAHALPAKMTIPVTVCILPTVVMIAIIPVIVKFNM